jgi:hypothetical protein
MKISLIHFIYFLPNIFNSKSHFLNLIFKYFHLNLKDPNLILVIIFVNIYFLRLMINFQNSNYYLIMPNYNFHFLNFNYIHLILSIFNSRLQFIY